MTFSTLSDRAKEIQVLHCGACLGCVDAAILLES